MNYFIITGTSRGLGQAIAEQLISPEHYLFCISREKNNELLGKGKNIEYFEFDLNNVEHIEELMTTIISSIDTSSVKGIFLVNNAAVIAPVAFVDSCDVKDITTNITVNLLAPITLTSCFIRLTDEIDVNKRILNISSSSAKHLHPGMSLYSATKAGLDVFTQCVGLEQNTSAAPVKIVSIWPGMIDTTLQEEARSQSKASFPSAEIFSMVKERGMLTTPEETAAQIIDYLFKEDIENGEIIDIYDYSKINGLQP
ncbi:(S)-benzoin forming benzil reductase [Paenibacillus sp. NPDC056722]|uniref:(S)-benzoin forming benzil reductase n=1 Tax=Paenibacillus sp. NPDC056722 TaxID=3345924 RepID=UPI003680550B